MKEKIEKLKEKIKAKPKLYKTLKVINFLFNLGAYLIALFTILSLSIGSSCSNQSNEVLAYGDYKKHTPKEAITFAQYDLYTISQIVSEENMQNYVQWVYEADGIDLYSITETYTRGFYVNGGAWFVDSRNLTSSNIDTDSTRIMTIQNLEFTAYTQSVSSNGNSYQLFRLKFISTISPNTWYGFWFTRVYNQNLGGSYTWYLGSLNYTTNNGSSYSYVVWTMSLCVNRPLSTELSWSRDFFGFNTTSSSVAVDRYNVGYQAGYTAGASRGYNNGYQDGYSAGSVGVTENPFNLLKNGFDAVADFLDIQILPGLNIGVLLFAPLIVTIIIVIIKMFRG